MSNEIKKTTTENPVAEVKNDLQTIKKELDLLKNKVIKQDIIIGKTTELLKILKDENLKVSSTPKYYKKFADVFDELIVSIGIKDIKKIEYKIPEHFSAFSPEAIKERQQLMFGKPDQKRKYEHTIDGYLSSLKLNEPTKALIKEMIVAVNPSIKGHFNTYSIQNILNTNYNVKDYIDYQLKQLEKISESKDETKE